MRVRKVDACAAGVPAAAGTALLDPPAAEVGRLQVNSAPALIGPSDDALADFDIAVSRIRAVLRESIGTDPYSDSFTELDMNEYDVAAFLCAVEDEFGLYIPDQDADRLTNVGDVARYVEHS
ncbi:phosphopantetheine-binding protein [Nocardia sp. NPDC051321]|uniref:phosphopantetheine-binding protein n=1 Tax=Nocardia sp. NPDC051321 TaxID=3364323 RepID=UPI0037B62D0A